MSCQQLINQYFHVHFNVQRELSNKEVNFIRHALILYSKSFQITDFSEQLNRRFFLQALIHNLFPKCLNFNFSGLPYIFPPNALYFSYTSFVLRFCFAFIRPMLSNLGLYFNHLITVILMRHNVQFNLWRQTDINQ